MRYFCIVVFLFLQSTALAFHFFNSDFENALIGCYKNHINTREYKSQGDVAVRLKKRIKDVNSGYTEPISPMNIGMDADAYFDYSMFFYNNLTRFALDKKLQENESDVLAQLQCQFDIWMIEQDQVDTEYYEKIARENFVHNFTRFSALFGTDEIPRDQVFDKENRHTKCYIMYFDKHSYIPANKYEEIIENITERVGFFRSYYILLTTMLDWKLDSHEAKVFAKKRLMYVRDLINKAGVNKKKFRGEIRDSTCVSSKMNIDKGIVKICIIDGLTGQTVGERLVDNFDFKQKGTKKPKVKIIKKTVKKI